MNIGLDYDGTITEDPDAWLLFCDSMRRRGHTVWIVTMRYPSERYDMDPRFKYVVEGTVFTRREAKGPYCEAQGLDIHVWIDDNPKAVHLSAKQIWGRVNPEGDVHVPVHVPKGGDGVPPKT